MPVPTDDDDNDDERVLLDLARSALESALDEAGDEALARGPRGRPGAKRARAALETLMPKRLARYIQPLRALVGFPVEPADSRDPSEALLQYGADPTAARCPPRSPSEIRLLHSAPAAVGLVLLLIEGDDRAARRAWSALVERAGLRSAERLVVELLTATDFVACSQMASVIRTWAAAVSPGMPPEVQAPSCMGAAEDDSRGPRLKRLRRR